MGGYVPAEAYTDEIAERVLNEILYPTVRALKEEGHPYKGVLSCSLLLTEQGPKVVDYVVRFCDVESQILIPMIETPLLDLFNAVIDGTLKDIELKLLSSSAVCVVVTSGGYPLEYEKGIKINLGDTDKTVQVYHAGTRLTDGELRTAGGRVLGIVSIGDSKEGCADNVYKNLNKISFDGMHFRRDIARD